MEDSGSASLASSFTDLMTSLAVIFILLLIAAANNAYSKAKKTQADLDDKNRMLAEVTQLAAKRRAYVIGRLRADLLPQLPGLQIQADEYDPLTVLVIPPKKLQGFVWNHAELPPNADLYLKDFAPKLAVAVCEDRLRSELSTVVVEGHADSSGKDLRNLSLSAQRSLNVVQSCLKSVDPAESPLPESTNECFAQLLTTSGRGRGELIMDKGIENPEASRRVEFKIRLKTFEARGQEQSILNLLKNAGSKPSLSLPRATPVREKSANQPKPQGTGSLN